MKMMGFNLKKNSADIGLKLGTLIFIISALFYLYDLKFFYNGTLSLISIPLIMGFGLYSIVNAKKLNNQFLSFKEAFTSYFICIVVGYLVISAGDIIIFKFVDPEAGKIINEELIIQTKIGFESLPQEYRLSDEVISSQLENMGNNPRYSYYSVFMQYMSTLLVNIFIGLISALILKKS